MKATKELDKAYEESGYQDHFRKLTYVEREEDPDLKREFEAEKDRFD